ncbi:MAG TPA: M23 family metallopeptidase [Thermoanaerobaculia bacterium]|nr:M23 family metallopeptidase [Thermoanaerobaculia bacterium]
MSFLIGALSGALTLFFSLQASGRLRPVVDAPTAIVREEAEPAKREPVETLAREIAAEIDSSVIKSAPLDRPDEAPAYQPRPATVAAGAQQSEGSVAIPVAGMQKSSLRDHFNDLRGGRRRHEAIDIMAKRGTPVVAIVDGKIRKLFLSAAGGITIYQSSRDESLIYYYAHLDSYVPNLKEGKQITKGEVLGYVGTSGNAAPNAPHLHFAVMLLPPTREWWKGVPINPYPLLMDHGVTYEAEPLPTPPAPPQ